MMTLFPHTLRPSTAPFDPSTVTGLTVWYKADGTLWQNSARSTPATADGDPVGAWDDASAGANHATQATAGSRPVLKTNQLNGRPSIRFDGVDDRLVKASVLAAQPVTILAVVKNPAFAGASENFIGSAAGASAFTSTAGKAGVFGGSSLIGATTVPTATAFIFAGYWNGASSKLYLNGGAADASGAAGATAFNGIVLGDYAAAGGGPFSGDLFEVLGWPSALSLTDLNNVGNYLASRWALTWTTAT